LLSILLLVNLELVLDDPDGRVIVLDATWVLPIAPVDGLPFSYGLISDNGPLIVILMR